MKEILLLGLVQSKTQREAVCKVKSATVENKAKHLYRVALFSSVTLQHNVFQTRIDRELLSAKNKQIYLKRAKRHDNRMKAEGRKAFRPLMKNESKHKNRQKKSVPLNQSACKIL